MEAMSSRSSFDFLLWIFQLITVSRLFEELASQDCSRTYLGRLQHGVVQSYNYPFDYANNLSCTYVIYLDVESNKSQNLCLTFNRFSLETSTPFCSFDYVSLGTNTRWKYCGVGLWQNGVEVKGNVYSNIWSLNLCWPIVGRSTFEISFSSDNSIVGHGFHATYQISDIITSQNATIDHAPCSSSNWTCFNRKCIPVNQTCNGIDNCGDGSDETYAHARCNFGPMFQNCTGGQTTPRICQNIFACDFSNGSSSTQDYCTFSHDGWSLSSSTTRSTYPSAPRSDHTSNDNGRYIYTTQSSSYLVGPLVTLRKNSAYCLSFSYFFFGKSSSLSVFINQSQPYLRSEWQRLSDDKSVGKWNSGEIFVPAFGALQVTFAVEFGSGLAIDDISLTSGFCSGVDVSCNFESGFCGWTGEVNQMVYKFGTIQSNVIWALSSAEHSDLPDHSSKNGSGSSAVAVLKSTKTRDRNTALLVSPSISASPDDVKCFKFWYLINGSNINDCRLSVLMHTYDDRIISLANRTSDLPGVWMQAAIEFVTNGPLQVFFEASSNYTCLVAIDELILENGNCDEGNASPTPTVSSECKEDEFQCASGQCLNIMLICLDHDRCGDGSDQNLFDDCPSSDSTVAMTTMGSTTLPVFTTNVYTTVSTTTTSEAFLPTPVLCNNDEIYCSGRPCLKREQICDGTEDCFDGSDEFNCTNAATTSFANVTFPSTCSPSFFLCVSDGQCIPSQLLCNGRKDCSDGSDEEKSHCKAAIAEWLGGGATAGIVVACCICLGMFIFGCFILARRHRRMSKRSHSSDSFSAFFSSNTIFSVSQNMKSRTPVQTIASTNDSGRNRDISLPAHLQGNYNGNTQFSIDEFPGDGAMHAERANATLPHGRNPFTRMRRMYRSLPPTPAAQQAVPPLIAALWIQQHGRLPSWADVAPFHLREDPGQQYDSAEEHIYEEPASLQGSTLGNSTNWQSFPNSSSSTFSYVHPLDGCTNSNPSGSTVGNRANQGANPDRRRPLCYDQMHRTFAFEDCNQFGSSETNPNTLFSPNRHLATFEDDRHPPSCFNPAYQPSTISTNETPNAHSSYSSNEPIICGVSHLNGPITGTPYWPNRPAVSIPFTSNDFRFIGSANNGYHSADLQPFSNRSEYYVDRLGNPISGERIQSEDRRTGTSNNQVILSDMLDGAGTSV